MNVFSGSKIAQQMYTRERRGLFRSTEGFDTVAKSDSLDNNFIKKHCIPSVFTMLQQSWPRVGRRMRLYILVRCTCSMQRMATRFLGRVVIKRRILRASGVPFCT